ncbi:MAG: MarC family protein [Bacteroidaceae bacterium]|nr:MarC family protein [Bacteroidaceae bacterium]
MLNTLNFLDFFSAFIVLFAVIDPIGAIPIVISVREQGRAVSALKAVVYSFILLCIFFFAGEGLLNLFGVDINSFAVAGGLVLFLMAMEMVLDIEIFKNSGPIKEATYVPLVFPLLAGAGSFTTLLSLRAEYSASNILLALCANMLVVYIVLMTTGRIQRMLGKSGMYFIKKFFGIILLAISVRLFTSNLSYLIQSVTDK